MREQDINPYIRFFQRRCSPLPYPQAVFAYDFRMIFVCKGNIAVHFAESMRRCDVGDTVIIPPGVGYRLLFDGTDVEYFIVNFDFTSEAFGEKARTPVRAADFLEEEIFSTACPPMLSEVRVFSGTERLFSVLEELEREYAGARSGYETICSALMKYVIGRLLCDGRERETGDVLSERVKAYVRAHFAEQISNRSIAAEMGYHPYHLGARFLAAEEETLRSYVERIRIEHAKKLLLSTQMPIYEVAEACGFAQASYFVKVFVRRMGMTPKLFRMRSM